MSLCIPANRTVATLLNAWENAASTLLAMPSTYLFFGQSSIFSSVLYVKFLSLLAIGNLCEPQRWRCTSSVVVTPDCSLGSPYCSLKIPRQTCSGFSSLSSILQQLQCSPPNFTLCSVHLILTELSQCNMTGPTESNRGFTYNLSSVLSPCQKTFKQRSNLWGLKKMSMQYMTQTVLVK